MALTTPEINQRLTELRNLRKLHGTQKLRIKKLEGQVRSLKEANQVLQAQNVILTTTVSDLKLQMEELRTIVFGRNKDKREDPDDKPPTPKVLRSSESYKRPLPLPEEVTETKDYNLERCSHCQGQLTEKASVTYFEEDLPLPQKKVVRRHTIEKGYCTVCRTWSVGTPLPNAIVTLGPTVKRYVTYLSVVARQSYAQIQDLLQHTYDFSLSQGEIAKILDREGMRLSPAYEQLKVQIRGEPTVHLDETGWKLSTNPKEQHYAWTMVGAVSAEAVFILGVGRGHGNADDLLGESTSVVVSDDYRVYRNLPNPHQLCTAHILRKLRDLAYSKQLTGMAHDHAKLAYGTFAGIYSDIEVARLGPNSFTAYDKLKERLNTFAVACVADPTKLAKVRTQIRERTDCYLTCLCYPHVTSDNNAAERSLRHLVIKRKTSFGSFSEQTAKTLSILLSVLLSYRQRGTLRDYLVGV